MDQIKIGKFILELRKKYGLTQSEFANKLNVTSQAVSKWENGRGIPDIELLKKISDEFDVNIFDLISGKKVKQKKSRKLILVTVLSILIVIGCIWFCTDHKDYDFTAISSANAQFEVKGVVVHSKNKKSIYISSITYLEEEFEDDLYLELECTLYETTNNIEQKISQCGNLEDYCDTSQAKKLSEFLKNIEFNIDNHKSTCNGINSETFYLVINAMSLNNKTITYKIPININEEC